MNWLDLDRGPRHDGSARRRKRVGGAFVTYSSNVGMFLGMRRDMRPTHSGIVQDFNICQNSYDGFVQACFVLRSNIFWTCPVAVSSHAQRVYRPLRKVFFCLDNHFVIV
jgi:hypothetical protein